MFRLMKRCGWLHVIAPLLAAHLALAERSPLEQASDLEVAGRFEQAARVLDQALSAKNLPQAERKRLEFDRDRLGRIRRDYSHTEDSLFEALQGSVRELSRAEFDGWVKAGYFDIRVIDGQRCFMGSSVSNLFFRHPELEPRRIDPPNRRRRAEATLESCRSISAAARAEHKPYVLPRRFEMVMTVTAKPDAAPAGEMICAWLPIPRRYPFQTDFELLSSSSPVRHLEPETSPIRSLQLEQPARAGEPTSFKICYNYTAYGVKFLIDPSRVTQPNARDPELKPFLVEGPHVVFSPEMKALAKEIAGNEANPALKAKRFHDWIAENIRYSYSIEYSTVRNLSEYCRSHRYGDCGQEALLLITLCRLNGIPARWQSGWSTFPGGKSIHDWSEIYLPPYGWMPVDPYMGIYAMQYTFGLPEAEKREIRDFYFGGLDPFRMIANSDHNQTLTPPKQSLRSDNVDFQRGELEWGSHNLYFDKYSYDLQLRELPPKP